MHWIRMQLGKPLVSLSLVAGAAWGVTQLASQWQDRQQAAAMRQMAKAGDILMISSTQCVYCDRARRWLDAQSVAYRECLIETDEACAATYRALLVPGTPTFVVRGKTITGMDKGRMVAALQSSS